VNENAPGWERGTRDFSVPDCACGPPLGNVPVTDHVWYGLCSTTGCRAVLNTRFPRSWHPERVCLWIILQRLVRIVSPGSFLHQCVERTEGIGELLDWCPVLSPVVTGMAGKIEHHSWIRLSPAGKRSIGFIAHWIGPEFRRASNQGSVVSKAFTWSRGGLKSALFGE